MPIRVRFLMNHNVHQVPYMMIELLKEGLVFLLRQCNPQTVHKGLDADTLGREREKCQDNYKERRWEEGEAGHGGKRVGEGGAAENKRESGGIKWEGGRRDKVRGRAEG